MENSGVKLTLLYTEAEAKMPYFKRDYYEQAFTKYCALCDDIYKEIDDDIKDLSDEETNKYLNSLSEEFVSIFANEYKSITKKGKQTTFVTNHNTPLVIYFFPAILNYNAKWSIPFCDLVKEKWNKTFTQMAISYGTYADIKGGFKTKLCYITTAVCESLDLPVDCKELTLLKDYRDNILAYEDGGEEIIHEYYDIAPTIVKRINKESDRNVIYNTLYNDYISKCINDIEEKHYEACKEHYMQMINDLKEKYIVSKR